MTEEASRDAAVVRDYVPDHGPRRVLLFNPPVYDIRFPWKQWHQPTYLLQLATLFRHHECDVRLIDAVQPWREKWLRRKRIRPLERGDTTIQYWRHGALQSVLAAELRAMKKEGWRPDEVYIEGFVTYWWEGVREAVADVRRFFPGSRVVIVGAYGALATEHAAATSGADLVVSGDIVGRAGLPLDTSLYGTEAPPFAYISVGTPDRHAADVLDEVASIADGQRNHRRIAQLVFADHGIAREFPEQFRSILQGIIERKLKVKLYALGNIYPRDIAEEPGLADLMRGAGFKQIAFADDRDEPCTDESRQRWISDYEKAISACTVAGFRTGTDALTAAVCVGRPGEQLEDVARFMTEVSHIAGSLIVVPYQPTPSQCPPGMRLELQNSKLFPFAEQNGLSYRAYQDILGLGALLNAKYRSTTFDFMGEGLIPSLVRSSLESQSWDPRLTDSLVPKKPIVVGYFNKEGKWVRS